MRSYQAAVVLLIAIAGLAVASEDGQALGGTFPKHGKATLPANAVLPVFPRRASGWNVSSLAVPAAPSGNEMASVVSSQQRSSSVTSEDGIESDSDADPLGRRPLPPATLSPSLAPPTSTDEVASSTPPPTSSTPLTPNTTGSSSALMLGSVTHTTNRVTNSSLETSSAWAANSSPPLDTSSSLTLPSLITKTPPNATFATSTVPSGLPSNSSDVLETHTLDCIPPKEGETYTSISVVYTATTTFFGDPAKYSAPHSPLATPNLCPPKTNPAFGAGPGDSLGGDDDDDLITVCQDSGGSKHCETHTIQAPLASMLPPSHRPKETVTFVTTDKNPSVVFRPFSTPDYGKQTSGRGDVFPNRSAKPPVPPQPRTTTFTVTVAPTKVIINSRTVTVHPTQSTQVTVDGRVFTINPTQVIGGGSTIQRPWNGQDRQGPVVPSTTNIGSIPVIMAPSGQRSLAVVDGTTLTIPSHGTTVAIGDKSITLMPTAIFFSGQTIPIVNDPPEPTEVFVEGGQMITAIGSTLAVIDGTTISYGEGIPATKTTVNGEVITIGPTGIVIGTTTIGGPKAVHQDTEIRIIGGATLTQIGESVLVVGGATFTVGPNGDGPLTTDVAGERITIGPSGVAFSTISLPYPFGPTIITSILAVPSATASSLPLQTGKDENGAPRTDIPLLVMSFCIAIGVWNSVFIS